MMLPDAFDDQAKAFVLATKLRAAMQLEERAKSPHPGKMMPPPGFRREEWIRDCIIRYVLTVFAAYAEKAWDLGRNWTWTALRVQNQCDDFLCSFTIAAIEEFSHLHPPQMFSFGTIYPNVMYAFKSSTEWDVFQRALLALADDQSKADFIYADTSDRESVRERPIIARQYIETTPPPKSADQKVKPDTINAQIDALRTECDLSIEELAEKIRIDPTNVSRHVRGISTPSRKTRQQYEAFFFKMLNKKVLLPRTQPKRS